MLTCPPLRECFGPTFFGVAGLATNNAVMIVASMLVSPLMGPILAIAFGTSIQDRELMVRGIQTEVVGLGLTFITGLVSGETLWVGGD